MASLRREIIVNASVDEAWDAIADIGALHTRLVPGFVVATTLEANARVVTFANGATVREPIVSRDATARRLAWTSEGGRATHYNAAVQAFAVPAGGARIVWIVDVLPDALAPQLATAMDDGMAAMQGALDAVAVSPPAPMVMRLWRGFAHAGSADAYEAMLKPELLPGVGKAKGYERSWLLRREAGAETEFVTLMLWDSLDAIRALAGPDVETAIVPAERRRHLARFDAKSSHYAVAATHARDGG
ncbi:MAG: SRPBCC family protein [Roseiarcus sp.]|jgi:heme-degrading monooxygenase HmoA